MVMSVAISSAAAARHSRRYAGTGGYEWRTRTMFMGVGANETTNETGPQAFLINIEPPGGSIRPHFHSSRQFQIFVGGKGTIGRKEPLDAVAIHYTDAFTPYGPIRIEEEGLSFFTLRHSHDTGAQYMPESRSGLKHRPGRTQVAHVSISGAALGTGGTATTTEIFAAPDGLLASRIDVSAHEHVTGPPPSDGDGAYWLVLTGAVKHGALDLPPNSLIYVEPNEPPLQVQGGADGAVLLLLQFGKPTSE